MNHITIFAPRWRDRSVLVADHKLGADNTIAITCTNKDGSRPYPQPFRLSGVAARSYPTETMKTKAGGAITVRVIPLDELLKEVSND